VRVKQPLNRLGKTDDNGEMRREGRKHPVAPRKLGATGQRRL